MPPDMIPLFDLRLSEADLDAVAQTLRSGWLTMGPRTQEFEARFAEHLGVKHALAVSSCTAALHLAYLGAGVGPGDEVIVPSFTFAATATAVIYAGGTPVFADIIGQHEPSLDVQDVARRITPQTKAVTVVHFAGYPAPTDQLRALCDEHGLAFIEDAAHAPSATTVDGSRRLGSLGQSAAFSFFANKVLSVGEGGLLATDDDDVAELARTRRSHAMTSGTWDRHTGRSDTYDVAALGFNYRMDEPRAALLLSRMRGLEQDIAQRRALTRRYRSLLAALDEHVLVPFSDAQLEASSAYVMPIMLRDPERQGPLRLALREKHGVQTSLFYPCAHRFTAYRDRFGDVSLPQTERASAAEVTLPLFAHMTTEQQDRVIAALTTELTA